MPSIAGAQPATREITYSQALNEALREEMHRDESLVVLGEDIAGHGGLYRVTQDLLAEFGPERVIGTPISELAIAGVALGAALAGCRTVAEFQYSDFLLLAMDQIVNQAAKVRYMTGGQATPSVVFRAPEGAGSGLAAQHSQSLHAWYVHVPGLVVVTPSNPADAKGLLKSAIRSGNPTVFLEHRSLYFKKGPVPEGEHLVPIGVGTIKRAGSDLTVLATSNMVNHAMAAAELVAAEGMSAEVIDPRTLKPLDLALVLESVRRTHRLVVVDEGHRMGGYAATVSALVQEEAFDELESPILRVAARDVPYPFAKHLEEAVMASVQDVVSAIRRSLFGAETAHASPR